MLAPRITAGDPSRALARIDAALRFLAWGIVSLATTALLGSMLALFVH